MGKTRRHNDRDPYEYNIHPTFIPQPPPPQVASTSNKDRTLKCVDCGNNFLFSVSDQEFYKRQGFVDPKRCFRCRTVKRQSRNPASK